MRTEIETISLTNKKVMFMQKELLKKLIALNCAQKPNRGLAFVNDLHMYDRLTHESWLAKMVDDIRSGNDALKDELPAQKCAQCNTAPTDRALS